MKKKTVKSVILAMMTAVLLTGCGSSDSSSGAMYMASDTAESYSYNGVKSAQTYSTEAYMDYGNATISGEMCDYSYQFNGQGEVKDKQTVLDVYDKVQEFVISKEGYISNFNNNFNGYPIQRDRTSFSRNEIYYTGSGYLSFSVEIKNEYAEDVIQILDDFINENKLYVTRYIQTATNYKNAKIVDSYSDDYYRNYQEITAEDLRRMLEYSTIDVRLSYYIPRNGAESFRLKCVDFFDDIKEVVLSVLLVVVIVLGVIWALTCLGVVPIYKCIRKSIMKHRKKRPELYPVKELRIVSDVKPEAVQTVAEQKTEEK